MIASACAIALSFSASTADVRTIVEDALADSSQRSLLSGHDGGFFLGSTDERFRLEIGGFTQFRYIANFTDDSTPDDFTGGFTIRRTRVTFSGHVIDPSLTFKVTHSFSRSSGASTLSDGYVEKDLGDGYSIRFGQFKLPFWREELHSAKRLLAVDRSLTRDAFSLRRSQGVMLSYAGERVKLDAAISNGGSSANTGFAIDPTDVGLTARAQVLLDGGCRPFRRGGATRGAEFSWVVTGAVHYERNGVPAGTPGERILAWTADTEMKGDGWSLLLAYVGREDSTSLTGAGATDHAVLVQGAFRAMEDIEPFARFETIYPDSDRPGDDPVTSLAFGANWYIHGDAMKLTADVLWTLDASASNDVVGGSSGSGFLSSAEGDQVAVRVQLQLVF